MTEEQKTQAHAKCDEKWKPLVENEQDFPVAWSLLQAWKHEKEWIDAGCPIITGLDK